MVNVHPTSISAGSLILFQYATVLKNSGVNQATSTRVSRSSLGVTLLWIVTKVMMKLVVQVHIRQ